MTMTMSLQRKSKKSSRPKISKSVPALQCARVEACPRRRWLWQPTWAAGCALFACCKLSLRMLACAPCVCPLNSLLCPPAPPPRAAQTAALAALLVCEAARCAALRGGCAAVRFLALPGVRRRGAVRCGAVWRGAARCGAVRRVRCDALRWCAALRRRSAMRRGAARRSARRCGGALCCHGGMRSDASLVD